MNDQFLFMNSSSFNKGSSFMFDTCKSCSSLILKYSHKKYRDLWNELFFLIFKSSCSCSALVFDYVLIQYNWLAQTEQHFVRRLFV